MKTRLTLILLAGLMVLGSEVTVVAQPPAQPTLEALRFDPALPTEPMAWVNNTPISAAALLETILRQNLSTAVSAIVSSKVLEIELALAQIEITDEEIAEELAAKIEQVAPGKTAADLDSSISIDHLRRQSRTERGWKKLFWTANKIPEDQRHQETHQLLLQFFIRQKMQDYDQRMRGQDPAPVDGAVAQIIHKPSKNEIIVGASEALDLLMGLVKQGAILDALDQVVNSEVIRIAMEKAGKTATEAEIEAWAAEENAKYQAPFTWPVVLRMKGTTVDREKERYQRILAWKRCTGREVSKKELDEFLAAHKGFFKGETKRVSHVLVRTQDEVSGLPLSPEAQKEAADRAQMIYQKALEGVEFAYLATNYSDDHATAKGQGRLPQPVKEWGGGLDTAFQKAAWTLDEVGAITKPVQSQFGWHIIRLDENKAASAAEPDWNSDRYQVWIEDEYVTQQMENWMAELKASAKVRLADRSKILALKDRRYSR